MSEKIPVDIIDMGNGVLPVYERRTIPRDHDGAVYFIFFPKGQTVYEGRDGSPKFIDNVCLVRGFANMLWQGGTVGLPDMKMADGEYGWRAVRFKLDGSCEPEYHRHKKRDKMCPQPITAIVSNQNTPMWTDHLNV